LAFGQLQETFAQEIKEKKLELIEGDVRKIDLLSYQKNIQSSKHPVLHHGESHAYEGENRSITL